MSIASVAATIVALLERNGLLGAAGSSQEAAITTMVTALQGLYEPTATVTAKGTGTLSSGTATLSSVPLTATSRIMVTRKSKGSSTAVGTLEVPSASRDTGASTFVVNALKSDATVETGDVSTFDYVVFETTSS